MLVPIALGAVALFALSQLGKKKAAPVANTITGPSGTPWAFAKVREGVDPSTKRQVQVFDLFLLPNGTPVVEYAQDVGTLKNTFLSSPLQANDPILLKALSDFQIAR